MPMFGDDGCVDAAANVETSTYAHKIRLARSNEIVKNLVRNGLMKRTFISVRPNI